MIYFLICIFLFACIFLVEIKLDKQAGNVVFLVLSTLLILFVGLRGDIEPDYENYLDIFQHSKSSSYKDFEVEPLYLFLNKTIRLLGGAFPIIVFIMAFISILPKLLFFKKYSPNFAVSSFIFFCGALFLFDFIATRQAVAIALFMFSLQYIQNRSWWNYFWIIILASGFHISALILLPCYFILNKEYSNIKLYLILCLCAVLNLLQVNVGFLKNALDLVSLPGATIAKLAIYSAESEFGFISIKQIILGFLFVFIKNRINPKNDMLNIFVNIYVLGVFLGTLLNEIPQFSYRVKWYFFSLEAILVPYTILYFSRNQSILKNLLYCFLFLIYVYSLFGFLDSLASRDNYIFPYKFFFE
jgi:hypothetical protein